MPGKRGRIPSDTTVSWTSCGAKSMTLWPRNHRMNGLASWPLRQSSPLIDLYWPEAIDTFDAMAVRDARLRRAVSGCEFADAVPEAIRQRLARLVRPEDDLG